VCVGKQESYPANETYRDLSFLKENNQDVDNEYKDEKIFRIGSFDSTSAYDLKPSGGDSESHEKSACSIHFKDRRILGYDAGKTFA
jgi:hypothetical protein